MGMDTSALAFPKGTLRIEVKRTRRLTATQREKMCREEVWRLYGRVCCVPGCRAKATEQHHIVFKSRSIGLKYAPTNRAPLCMSHHRLLHAGKIRIHPRTSNGELLITGERKYLEFKL